MMECEPIDYSSNAEKVTTEAFDCIWIHLAKRSRPSPFKSRVLQWLDWKLRGQLTRYLIKDEKNNKITFLPTLKVIPTPFLALLPNNEFPTEDFQKNCQGLKLKHTLYFSEENLPIGKNLLEAAKDCETKISWGIERT